MGVFRIISFSAAEIDRGFVTVSQVAKKLGVCSETIRRSIVAGILPHIKTPTRPGKKRTNYRLKPADVVDWAERCC